MFVFMPECDYCGKKIEGVLPHKCKYCGLIHCHNHLLPESHNCAGLEEHKKKGQDRWKNVFTSSTSHKFEERGEEESKPIKMKHRKHNQKTKVQDKIKCYFLDKYRDLVYWLKKREHYKYNFERRASYLITTILIFVASLVGFSIFYSNATKLNEIELWIIKLGGVLILASLFFAIKFGWRLGKEVINILKRQRNWLKYLIIILVIFLLWQGYTNKDTVLNPVFDVYNQTNFSLFAPVGLGNFSLDSELKSASYNYNDNLDNEKSGNTGIKSPLKPDIEISSLEKEVHSLINEERRNQGLSTLSWDGKLSEIARGHSQDMATNNYFSHNNLRGQDPTDRAMTKGYNCYKDYGSYYTEGIAENIFQNNLYDSVTYVNLVPFHSWNTQSEIAQSTVQGWMESPGHRQNILTATYDKEGIGIAISSDDKVYITENFC